MKIIKRLGKEFLTSTSMHGLKYIGEDNRHIFERYKRAYYNKKLKSEIKTFCCRVLWIFMFGFGLMFSMYLCWGMVNKYYSSPVRNSNQVIHTHLYGGAN